MLTTESDPLDPPSARVEIQCLNISERINLGRKCHLCRIVMIKFKSMSDRILIQKCELPSMISIVQCTGKHLESVQALLKKILTIGTILEVIYVAEKPIKPTMPFKISHAI